VIVDVLAEIAATAHDDRTAAGTQRCRDHAGAAMDDDHLGRVHSATYLVAR
jgi:hypothetical protein